MSARFYERFKGKGVVDLQLLRREVRAAVRRMEIIYTESSSKPWR